MIRNLFKAFGGGTPAAKPAGGQDAQFDEDYSEFVNKEFTQRQSERRSQELQWKLNAEFVGGNQYLEINSVTNAIEEIPKLSYYSEREVFNQISTIHETRIAKMSRQKPGLKTRPASSDDSDISSARVTSMLLGSTWADQLMNESYEDFISWLELCGTAFFKTTWSKNKGRVIFDPNQQQQLQAPAGAADGGQPGEYGSQPQMPNQTMREGDIDTVVVPAFEIFPDSSMRRGIRDCRSIIHAKAYHVNEIEEMWGVQVEPENVDVMTLQNTSTGGGGLGYGYSTVRASGQTMKDHAVLKEYYERPCLKYPQGRYIVVAGKKTLYSGALPYMLGQDGEPDFPFVRCVSIDSTGFWGRTVIERCIPIQRRYNALRNRKAEYLNMVAIGQWYAPIGSVDEGVELSNAPGNIIWYRPGINGAKPEPVQWPNLPNSFEMEEQTLMQEFTSVSGVSELSRFAEAPSGVKSGTALSQAAEQDDTRIATSIARIANASIDMGRKWIRLYRQFVQEPRLLRYVGGNREADVRQWEKSDLRSDDVFIENLAALGETPSQRRQMVFDLLSAGLFMRPELATIDEQGKRKVFEMLEFGNWESAYEDDHYLQQSRARSENQDIMQGIPRPVMDFDDHNIHIQEHNRQRMQAEYDELMQSPQGMQINAVMMQHIAEHIQLALQAMPKEPVQPPGPANQKKPPSGSGAK